MRNAPSPARVSPALVGRLRGLRPSCGPVRLVAVDGPSGAGKSTFAGRLGAALGAPVVHSDDFPVPWDGDPAAWLPPLRDRVLTPLGQGRTACFRRYDWRLGAYAEEVEVPAAPLVIVEGVGAADTPAAFLIWVDAPYALRRHRAAARGDDLGDWDRWTAAETRHFAAHRTRDRADLTLDGTRTT